MGGEKGKGEKGKGKGKGRPKTPADLGFERSDGGTLWVRAPTLVGGSPVGDAECLEIGNLDEKKSAAKGGGRLCPGRAHLEVLCNRQSVLGNPFSLGKKVKLEEMRAPVLRAYEEYLEAVLAGAAEVDIVGIGRRHGLSPEENCAKDWREVYDAARGPRGVREAVEELQQALGEARRSRRGGLRLVCHCAPLPCHTRLLGERLRPDGVAGGGPQKEREGFARGELDGRWVGQGAPEEGIVAEIQGHTIWWPSGRRATISEAGGGEFVLEDDHGSSRARFAPAAGELLWDDGDVWVRMQAEAPSGDVDALAERLEGSLRLAGAAVSSSPARRWQRGVRDRGADAAAGAGARQSGGAAVADRASGERQRHGERGWHAGDGNAQSWRGGAWDAWSGSGGSTWAGSEWGGAWREIGARRGWR